MAELRTKYDFASMGEEQVDYVLKEEVGHVFSQVLEHAGVYKCTAEGRAAFERFIEEL